MSIPPIVRIGVLVIVSTAFYTYVGQMVPQSEVYPPEETVIGADMTTAEMVAVGREVMDGKGLCFTCHTIGQTGALRFPDLEGIGARAAERIPGMSDVEYLAESLYEPNTFIVEGFNPGMPPAHRPPIGLTDQEALSVIAYLQSLGGTPTVTLQTTHRFLAAPATPEGAPPAEAPGAGADPSEGTASSAPPAATGAAPAAAPDLALVATGREIVEGKGICLVCHTIGQTGALMFPDLEGIGARAADRIPGMSDVEYLAQSLYEPNAFVVPGFNAGMLPANQPPASLTDQEILAVIAYLQSLGGTPTVTRQTTHRYLAAPGGARLGPAVSSPPLVVSHETARPAGAPGSPAQGEGVVTR